MQVESESDSLVDFLKSLKEDLYLRAAAAGSEFASVFAAATLQGYIFNE